ncbi:MAG: hypothetical protein GX622_08625 [Bacteroidales bacterium]|nr:hypothetical protein [Bacteroidales bacterium]
MVSRRLLYLITVLSGIALLLSGCVGPEKDKPNIILIIADDLGYADTASLLAVYCQDPGDHPGRASAIP